MDIIKSVYNYREMLKTQVKKDLRARYKGSFFGFLWNFANPLLQLAVFTIVFKDILKVQIPNFAIFIFVGLLPWIFFSSTILSSSSNIVGNANLIKKVYFPREVLPISLVTSGLMNYIFGLLVLFPVLLINDIAITWVVIYLPFVIAIQYFFVLGLSFIFSSLNVYFRDIGNILDVLVMLLFYMTPVVYSVDILPEHIRNILEMNPMAQFIGLYRDILIYDHEPNIAAISKLFVTSLLTLLVGLLIFKKLQKGFAEEL